MAGNPWVDRLRVDWTDAELDAVICRPAPTLPDLSLLSPELAAEKLRQCWHEMTVTSRQMREGIRLLHAFARAAAEILYPSELAFVQRMYALEPSACPLLMKCLTGLAGTGKTELIRAFIRSLLDDIEIEIVGHARVCLKSTHVLTARSGLGLAQILGSIVLDERKRSRGIVGHARHQLTLDGIALLLADEMQFLTQSEGATQAVNILLMIAGLGPALVFASNFSLLHKLVAKPHEQQDRLLSDLVVIEPDPLGGEDFEAYVFAVLDVSPVFAELRVRRGIADDFHGFSFGIRRYVPRLAALAYLAAQERGAKTVAYTDLDNAYFSRKFAASRKIIKVLTDGPYGELKNRKDLFCPLAAEGILAISDKERARAARDQELAERALECSLTAEERSHVRQAQAATGTSVRVEHKVRPKPTSDALRAGKRAYEESNKGRRKT